MRNAGRKGCGQPAEMREIREGAEPQTNRVAGNVAQRGLGTSGAGAAVVAEAQQAPFDAAQEAAAQEVSRANETAFNLASLLIDSDSFNEDLGAVVKNLTVLEDLLGDPDPVVDGVFSTLQSLYEEFQSSDGAFAEAFSAVGGSVGPG